MEVAVDIATTSFLSDYTQYLSVVRVMRQCSLRLTQRWKYRKRCCSLRFMTQSSWSTETTQRIADAIRARRGSNSAQWLSDQTAELGYRVTRSRISDLETGRRNRIDVTELMMLARALGIPPLLLLYPGTPGETVRPLPPTESGTPESTSIDAAMWFSGEQPLRDVTDEDFFPKSDTFKSWYAGAKPLILARQERTLLGHLVRATRQQERFLNLRNHLASTTDPDTELQAQLTRLELGEAQRLKLIDNMLEQISDCRAKQRDAGMTTAPLPPGYSDLDDEQ